MAFSHSANDDAVIYTSHINDILEYAAENFLQNDTKEEELAELNVALNAYINAYLATYPTPVNKGLYQPQQVRVDQAYQYIVSELFEKTHWRDGLNRQDKMPELLLGLKLKLQSLLATKADRGYLASRLIARLHGEDPSELKHFNLAQEILRDTQHNMQLMEALGHYLVTTLDTARRNQVYLDEAHFNFVRDLLRNKNVTENLQAALSAYLAELIFKALSKKIPMEASHLALATAILSDPALSGQLAVALQVFEQAAPIFGKQPVDHYKIYHESDEDYAKRILELLTAELNKPKPKTALDLEREREKRSVAATARLKVLSAKTAVNSNALNVSQVVQSSQQAPSLSSSASVNASIAEMQRLRDQQLLAQREQLAKAALERQAQQKAREEAERRAQQAAQEMTAGPKRKTVTFNDSPDIRLFDPSSLEPDELELPSSLSSAPNASQGKLVLPPRSILKAPKENLALPLLSNVVPAASKTPWWKYGLAALAFLAGCAAIISGVGVLLAISTAIAVATIAVGAVLVSGGGGSIAYCAYQDCKTDSEADPESVSQASEKEKNKRVQVSEEAVSSLTSRVQGGGSPTSAPVSLTDFSIFPNASEVGEEKEKEKERRSVLTQSCRSI